MREGKLHPQNIDAEKKVLGAILLNPKCFDDVQDNFSPDIFYLDKHKAIAEAMFNVKSKGSKIDIVTVFQELKKIGKNEIAGGAYALTELTNDVASSAHLEQHLRIVIEQATKRNIIELSSIMIEKAYDEMNDTFDLIDEGGAMMSEISKRIITNKITDSGSLAISTNEKNTLIRNSGGVTGLKSGFVDLDKTIGGWQKTDLIILAARPSMGKTALATQLLSHPAIAKGVPTAIFSLEMSNEQLYMRMKAQQSGIDLNKFTKYGLNMVEVDVCDAACKGLYHAPIYFDDMGGVSILAVKNKARKLKREKKIELLVIDYLQLIRSTKRTNNREQEVSQISMELKALAKELEISVICLSQLSRKCEDRGDKKPQLADLRDSGSIEQDADIVMFIYRPDYYGIKDENGNSLEGKAAIMIAKNRNGSTGDVILNWNGSQTKFYDNNTFDLTPKIEPNEAF